MEILINYGNNLKNVSDKKTPEQNVNNKREEVNNTEGGTAEKQEKSIPKHIFKSREKSPALKSATEQQKVKEEDPMHELSGLIGLRNVKILIQELEAYVIIQKQRNEKQLVTEPMSLHMIFKGNPGTGKTTVARFLGKIFFNLGILSKGHLVEVERADLVGEYIGHTAQKTKEHIKKALGGILFIDEAYSLARGGEKDFGKEAIDVLVKGMEDHKDDFVLVLAGYNEEMECFMRTNPGLTSRFATQLEFPDYTNSELMSIAELMLKKKEYLITPGAKTAIENFIKQQSLLGRLASGNARIIRNLIEKAVRRQAVRLVKKEDSLTKEDLLIISDSDILEAVQFLNKQQNYIFQYDKEVKNIF